MFRRIAAVPVAAVVVLSAAGGATPPARDYPLRPVSFTRVALTDGFWLRRLETNRAATIPAIFEKNRTTGRVDNFAVAARLRPGRYSGQRYNDTDVYKAVEGACRSLATHPDAALGKEVEDLVALIAAAQEPDGYLFTARTADPANPVPGIGPARWSELAVSHELYNAGHLYEAAVAHFEATGRRTLLDVAIRNANLVESVFGPDRKHGFPGHQEIELGLAKLYRVTGDEKYLRLAKYFLDQRGRDMQLTIYPPGSRFAIYNDPVQIQAHRPVLAQTEAVGHAVRAMYMYSGMADVAALTGDAAYAGAVGRLWDDVVSRKLYLTGGIGARPDGEAFGAAYELPNRTAYNETCAAVGNVLWNHRMFLLHGDAKYLDVLERVLYNGLISGVSLDGRSFFYANPLESDGRFGFNQGQAGRSTWFDVACCPGNVCRFLPSLPGYFYATGDHALYVTLFAASSASLDVDGQQVRVVQETRYPWDGLVTIRLQPAHPQEFDLRIRIPGWARGIPAPGGLYRYLDAGRARAGLEVNGTSVPLDVRQGFASVRRMWTPGDTVTLRLPMAPRRVVAAGAVREDAGRVALERGPLVYCAEGADNGGGVLDMALPDGAALATEDRPSLLGGVVVIRGRAVGRTAAGSGARTAARRELLAIPYFAWANRGPGQMAVWLHRAGSRPAAGAR